jgi:uncharacterized protein YkwD
MTLGVAARALPELCVVVLLLHACRPPVTTSDAVGSGDSPPQASAIVTIINEERKTAGLSPLRETPLLRHAAQLQATQMAHVGRIDHVLASEPHPRPEDRLAAAGYEWQAWAENLAFGFDPAGVVAGWMASPGHRANILNPTYTETGAGFALDRSGRQYYAQVFGQPRR